MGMTSSLGAWGACIGGVGVFFAILEGVASDTTKATVRRWLQEAGPGEETGLGWPTAFIASFESMFGRRLNLKDFGKSCIVSLGCILILTYVWRRFNPEIINAYFYLSTLDVRIFIVICMPVFFNFLPFYISLLKSRYIVEKLGKIYLYRNKFRTSLLILYLDIILTYIIASLAFFVILYYKNSFEQKLYLAMGLITADYTGHKALTTRYTPKNPLEVFLFSAEVFLLSATSPYHHYGILFYSTFFASIWIGLYVVSGFIIRHVRGSIGILLPINSKPILSLGCVSIIVLTILFIALALFYPTG
jgi:hypothetical protein